MSNRDSHNMRVLGKDLFDKVSQSNILLIGAGGIGCELLKDLVMTGFKNIKVIDLDTIDISNLNRQFLFQRKHVKQAKAHVAKESAHKFNPTTNIESLQANIKETQFSVQWFSQFTMVLNALDNLEARRHVNAMCLAADIPLVESGTEGYFGQTYIIKKGVTECFDCQEKPSKKTYPVCTIRSTPSEPIHCIVWAKSFLFSELFGNSEDEEALEPDSSSEMATEIAALKRETEELKAIKEAAGSPDYTKKIFTKVFESDIERLLSMESMWEKRKKPTALNYDALDQMDLSDVAKGNRDARKVWDLKENFDMFKESATKLAARLLKEKEAQSDAILTFDKDDADAMDFVTAASNLRAYVFDIGKKSLFDVKSIAGNIIPAIATTNAIIAGLVILKALGILRGELKENSRVHLHTGSRLLSDPNNGPNPNCNVCKSRRGTVNVDFEKATLNHLIEKVILLSIEEGGAGMDRDDIGILDGNRMIYDVDFQDMADTPLSNVGLKAGTILRITNDDGDEIDLNLDAIDPAHHEDTVILVRPISKPVSRVPMKRKLEEEEEENNEANKKTKTIHTVVDDVIHLDEDEDDDDILLLD
ncbi:ubiquitin-activating enzyme E1 3 [Mucor mucedo]|uniref:ubiquitin-activating enzyme E1 3 n=1 Tax=Mucor mucedo TaxID=29922 RepID=UPI00221F90A0|nr:ubiquitin-activating enzyme E1 3 [Mucor mucedo]KAI7896083.1 ubiquitin-activating enzyme E1 3 [Mucor mucedo]